MGKVGRWSASFAGSPARRSPTATRPRPGCGTSTQACLDNELYIDPKTGMLFADAKVGLAEIIASIKSLVAS
jgi:hypothetical protein